MRFFSVSANSEQTQPDAANFSTNLSLANKNNESSKTWFLHELERNRPAENDLLDESNEFSQYNFVAIVDDATPSLLVQLRPIGLLALGLGTGFCIFANFLTLFLLLRCRPLQRSSRTTNLYVLSLCLADLGVGTVAMPLALTQEWISAFPFWLCQVWQLSDLLFTTISLYSTCAIALDRVWNLEQPLRVFTRSRRRARRLMCCIWVLPLLIWLPVYLSLYWPNENDGPGIGHDGCFPPRDVAKRVYWVALPALYIPAALLIGLFLRISLVVHRHLKFLREHSSLAQCGTSPSIIQPATLQLAQNSPKTTQNGHHPLPPLPHPHSAQFLLRTPGTASPHIQHRHQFRLAKTFDNISTTIANGNVGPFLLNQKGTISPLMAQNGRKLWRQRAATSAEEVMAQWRKSPTIMVHDEEGGDVDSAETMENGQQSTVADGQNTKENAGGDGGEEKRKCSLMMANQRQKTSSLASRPPSFGSADNDDSSLSSDDKKECLLRKLSASFLARRPSSSRFSMIALSENLADLLQREGISQQVKAAKAVGLILCCFLFCWFPFLLVWPIRLFSPNSVSDRTFRLCLWLNYACSTFNPLLYALSNPKVRAAFGEYIIGCKFLRKDGGGSAKNTRRSNTGVFV